MASHLLGAPRRVRRSSGPRHGPDTGRAPAGGGCRRVSRRRVDGCGLVSGRRGSSDVVTHPDPSHVDWVTAVALELAFSNIDDASGVARLREVARDDPVVLERARAQMHGVTVGDAATRSRAMDLLDHAMTESHRST